jgi:hypothetical protein
VNPRVSWAELPAGVRRRIEAEADPFIRVTGRRTSSSARSEPAAWETRLPRRGYIRAYTMDRCHAE